MNADCFLPGRRRTNVEAAALPKETKILRCEGDAFRLLANAELRKVFRGRERRGSLP
jgi:hypothetical protein